LGDKNTDEQGRFTKGHVSWHKGKTKKDFPQLSNAGRKPGFVPLNKLDLDEDEIERLYLETDLNLREISELFGCSRPTIGKILRNRGVYKMGTAKKSRSFWTLERVAELSEIYPTWPTEDVAEYFGKTVSNIGKQAENFGIKKEIPSHAAKRRTPTHTLCSGCNQWKLNSDFYKNNSRTFLLHSECKECMLKAQKIYAEKYPEKVKALARHLGGIRRSAERESDVTIEYLNQLQQVFEDYGRCPICDEVVDGEDRVWWLEHATALSRGGTHSKDNLVYTCNTCNNSKGPKSLEEFCGLTVDEVLDRVEASAWQQEPLAKAG